MLGRYAPSICRAVGPGQVIGDVLQKYMKKPDGYGYRASATRAVNSSKIWLWVMLAVASTLFFIHPAPTAYLLAMALLGGLWGGLLILTWKTGKWGVYLLLAAIVSGSSTLAGRLFHLESQIQEVQGIMLAFALVGVLLTVFRNPIFRFLNYR